MEGARTAVANEQVTFASAGVTVVLVVLEGEDGMRLFCRWLLEQNDIARLRTMGPSEATASLEVAGLAWTLGERLLAFAGLPHRTQAETNQPSDAFIKKKSLQSPLARSFAERAERATKS